MQSEKRRYISFATPYKAYSCLYMSIFRIKMLNFYFHHHFRPKAINTKNKTTAYKWDSSAHCTVATSLVTLVSQVYAKGTTLEFGAIQLVDGVLGVLFVTELAEAEAFSTVGLTIVHDTHSGDVSGLKKWF